MSSLLHALHRPVIAAPMAGGPSTPALVCAVGEAGGLGFLAAGYLTAERLAQDVAAVRERGVAAFGVNVFVPPTGTADAAALREYARLLAPEAERYGVSLGEPVGGDDGYESKVDLLLRDPVPAVWFAFGLPDPAVVAGLHQRGSEVWATLTDPAQARAAQARGVDVIVVQGVEAGAHRGGVADTDDYALLPLLRLAASAVDTPLVGSGGIADGRGVAAVLAAGAAAVALGTTFLRTPEAGTSAVHRAALTATADTAMTRAFTGRRARGLVNRFLRTYDAAAPAGYPQVHQLTRPVRAAARDAGDPEAVHLWAGQAYGLATPEPAGEVVRRLAEDAVAALAEAAARLRLM